MNQPRRLLTLLLFAAVVLAAVPVLPAQTPAPAASGTTPVYVVAFLDTDSDHADQALSLMRAYGDSSRRAPGVRRFEVLRELARPSHFSFLEVWASEAARQAYEKSETSQRFRTALQPMLASPFDERLSHLEPL